MQAKSSRGVQQDDVWGAADALIAEGLRPTIERVRLKIGRGSPNTVSPMLEGWFGTLGQRLGVTEKPPEQGALPEPVLRAATGLWEVALLSAQEDAQAAIRQLRENLAADRFALEAREADLTHQKQALKDRQEAFDEALQLARRQVADLSSRLDESASLRVKQNREIDQLRAALADIEKNREAERRQSDDDGRKHAEERSRLVERSAANDRRMLAELDKERQETKRAQAALSETERKINESRTKWLLGNQAMTDQLNAANLELGAQRQALASANERAAELRGLLEAQSAVSAAALKQLNVRRASPERKKTASSLSRRRR